MFALKPEMVAFTLAPQALRLSRPPYAPVPDDANCSKLQYRPPPTDANPKVCAEAKVQPKTNKAMIAKLLIFIVETSSWRVFWYRVSHHQQQSFATLRAKACQRLAGKCNAFSA